MQAGSEFRPEQWRHVQMRYRPEGFPGRTIEAGLMRPSSLDSSVSLVSFHPWRYLGQNENVRRNHPA